MRHKSFFSQPKSSGGQAFRNGRPVRTQRPKRQGAYINPAKFVNKAVTPSEQPEFVPKHNFASFDFSDGLKKNIINKNYITPTPIQDEAIPPILLGRDLIGLANTGTGKTAAFMLPIIQRLLGANRQGLALIIVPTRELAVQIDEDFRAFARGLQLYAALCVGGASMHYQITAIKRRPQVVIGTPGRLKDLVNQGVLQLGGANFLVLDEADRMLDMGFIRDIRYLISKLPAKRQSLCFSATITPDIERLIHEILIDPITVSVRQGETSMHVEQDVISAGTKEKKLEILCELLGRPDFEKVLIFGHTKHGVQKLADSLIKHRISATAIHGNKSQAQRQKALKAFKTGQVKVLVATDVAARGLDIPDVSHVINFDQPNTYDDYIHRIGRTGRAGKQGQALTFVT